MILLCGIPSETPLAMVAEALEGMGAPFRVFNQRAVARYRIAWETGTSPTGTLDLDGAALSLSDVRGVYMRLMDDRLLPEVQALPLADPARLHARNVHEALFRWSEVAPCRVVNRADPQGSNGSKPFQAQLILQHGFPPPATLITNDPEAVVAFAREHGPLIYKSISAVRSIVKTLDLDDTERLERIRHCPVQFQVLVPGTDIRVHVVDRETFATAIVSSHVDYRYARRHGGTAELVATELPPEVADRCVALTRALGLSFAGIDLKRTPDGTYYCFEVNPSPAFSYFEANTGQPIARAVARFLAGTDDASGSGAPDAGDVHLDGPPGEGIGRETGANVADEIGDLAV